MASKENRSLMISSPSFEEGGEIPSIYTCDGSGINPPLNIDNIPDGCQTLAIIVEDPDAPKGTFDHWLVWNIPRTRRIEENANPGISGINGAGKTGYHGPCPPSGYHRYYFHLFALDGRLDLPAGANKQQLNDAMKPYILDKSTLVGRYKKVK